MPWIYEKERPEIHLTSTYNTRPKSLTTKPANYEAKIAMIRKNLSKQDDMLLKYRMDRLKNKKPNQQEEVFLKTFKILN